MTAHLAGAGGFALMVAAGYLYTRGGPHPLAVRLALAHMAGAAALAAGVTAGLVLTDQVLAAAGLVGLTLLALAGLLRGRAPEAGTQPPAPPQAAPGNRGPLHLIVWALLLVGLATALLRLILLPIDWDGWMIWQLKARAICLGDLHRLLTSDVYDAAHPDYPLLVPVHAWWLCGGVYVEKIGQAAGFLFFLDLLVLFAYEAQRRAGRTAALAGCVVMLSWAPLLKHSASGFADVPMAAYCFACAWAVANPESRLLLPLLGGALLTKNEGLFTLLGVASGAAAAMFRYEASGGCLPRTFRLWAAVGGALLAAMLPWSIMKHRWGLRADLLDPSRWPPDLARLLPLRLAAIARGLAEQAVAVGPYYPGWGFFWPVVAAAARISVRMRRGDLLAFWLMAAAHLVGIVAAYIITPSDVTAHIHSSLDRLALQFAPTALLALLATFFSDHAAARPPGSETSTAS